jgi:hypothetical protein
MMLGGRRRGTVSDSSYQRSEVYVSNVCCSLRTFFSPVVSHVGAYYLLRERKRVTVMVVFVPL